MFKSILAKVKKDIHLNELFKGSATTFILKVSGMILGFVVVVVIDRGNGSDGVGFYSVINQLFILAGLISCFGTNNSILRYIGQFKHSDEQPKIKTLFRNILKLIVPSNVVMGVLLLFFADDLAEHFFHNKQYELPVQAFALSLVLYAVTMVNIEFLRGIKRFVFSEFTRSLSRPLIFLLILLLFWKESYPMIYLVYFYVISIVLNFVISGIPVLSFLRTLKRPETSEPRTKEILITSLPMMVTAASSAIMTSISLFLIEYYRDLGDVGIYNIAMRITMFIGIILMVVNTIAGPKLAELYWAKRDQELRRFIRQSTKIMFWMALIATAATILLSPWILDFFGEEYNAGNGALITLSLGFFVNASGGITGLLLNMTGHQAFLRNVVVATIILLFLLSIILIPLYGITGAAIATSTVILLQNIANFVYVKRHFNIKAFYNPFSAN